MKRQLHTSERDRLGLRFIVITSIKDVYKKDISYLPLLLYTSSSHPVIMYYFPAHKITVTNAAKSISKTYLFSSV